MMSATPNAIEEGVIYFSSLIYLRFTGLLDGGLAIGLRGRMNTCVCL